MIREPYNINPYNEAKDLSQSARFSFTFGGDALVGYDFRVIDNNSANTEFKSWKIKTDNNEEQNGYDYYPTVMEGTVAIPSTEGANLTTIYNDQTYYLDYKEKNIDNNKGLVWQVRLFEDNTNPTNVIQSGEISEILKVENNGDTLQFKGTITGLLEESQKNTFLPKTYTPTDIGVQIPDCWTRNVVRIGNRDFQVVDYATHGLQYFPTQRSGSYYVGTTIQNLDSAIKADVYNAKKIIASHTFNFQPLTTGSQWKITKLSQKTDLVRTNFSGISKTLAIQKLDGSDNPIGDIVSSTDWITKVDLHNATSNNKSTSYYVDFDNLSEVGEYTTPAENGTAKLFRFTMKKVTEVYDENGSAIASTEILAGNRSTCGLSNLIYVDPSSGSYQNTTSLLTEKEIAAIRELGNEALTSTVIELGEKQLGTTPKILDKTNINFDENEENLIYTIELEDEKIQYNQTTTEKQTKMTRALAKEMGLIPVDAADTLIILDTSNKAINSSNTFFTYAESQNFKDEDYGLYTIGLAISEDGMSTIQPGTLVSQDEILPTVAKISFSVLNNYYDSNFYYFTNQVQPDLQYSINNVPFYSYDSYLQYIEENNKKPTETESALGTVFPFLKTEKGTGIGSESNPIVALQRFLPISMSLAGLGYNFKYYKYKIFAGKAVEKRGIVYEPSAIYESDKVFSRQVSIDYNNYVTDYDRYKIQLILTTSENGIYYYYLYVYPSIDMFQNDETDDLFALVNYDNTKGAAKISWTKDSAYLPLSRNVSETEYGFYKNSTGQRFPLKAQKIGENGYLIYSHKGSQNLNINPLNDFQVSFAIDKKLKDLETFSISPLVAFYNLQGTMDISLRIINNQFVLVENGFANSSENYTVIERKESIIDKDNKIDIDSENKIFQYALPKVKGEDGLENYLPNTTRDVSTISIDNLLAPTEQDLTKYCFHFYLYPWRTTSQNMSTYEIVRLYNEKGIATAPLESSQMGIIMESEEEWRLGYYGTNAGNNGDRLLASELKPFDTSKYISAKYSLSSRNSDQNFTGLTRVSLNGPAKYFGIFDINRRGAQSSADNFILNFNDGIVGFSNLTFSVYGYRIFRNSYTDDRLNETNVAQEFSRQLKNQFNAALNGAKMIVNDELVDVTDYNQILENETYYLGQISKDGETSDLTISGKELLAKIDSSIDEIRNEIDDYFHNRYTKVNFLSLNYSELLSALELVNEPEIIKNELIGEINILNNTIQEENGRYFIYDYNVPNQGYFRYQVVPMLADKTYKVLVAKTNDLGETVLHVDDEWWHMTNIARRSDGSYQPKDTWNFILGVQTAPYTQNFTKTFQNGFAPYPKVLTSLTNYKTTQFSGYLGKFNFDKDGGSNSYEDDINLIENWNNFIFVNNQILVKDPKGHVFIAAISNSQDSSAIEIPEMPTSVSCTLTQVGDTKDFKVYTL